tara:strand:- start:2243 stop:2818 length:576 start_codon:yes stop_codon:yes gene_type:complete
MLEKEEKKMPNIKLPYNAEGVELADSIADKVADAGGEISQDIPISNASMRNTNMDMDSYAGGGNVNIDSMGYYKEGGKIEEGGRKVKEDKKKPKTTVVRKDVTVGGEKVGTLKSLKTDFVDSPLDEVVTGVGKAAKNLAEDAYGAAQKVPGVVEKASKTVKTVTEGLKKKLKKKDKKLKYKDTDGGGKRKS